MIREVVEVHPVPIPGAIRRAAPRPAELRPPNYDSLFDDETLFYDVFPHDGRLVMSGPPSLNLLGPLKGGTWRVGGRVVDAHIADLDRTSGSYLKADASSGAVISHSGDDLDVTFALESRSHLDWFEGSNVVFTKSKNNSLQWIRDWAKFYSIEHGADAALVYDNGSTAYDAAEVLDALDIPSLRTAVVVRWPFKFGPQGGGWDGMPNLPWDSDFCQYSILQHARFRFLHRASAVVSHDIDELALSATGDSIFEIARRSQGGYIQYNGVWIENVEAPHAGSARSFGDYLWREGNGRKTTSKWAVVPGRCGPGNQWKTHRVVGFDAMDLDTVHHRHWVAISTNWKFSRSKSAPFDPGRHTRDFQIEYALHRSIGSELRSPFQGEEAGVQRARRLSEVADLVERAPASVDAGMPNARRPWCDADQRILFEYRHDGLAGVAFVLDHEGSEFTLGVVTRTSDGRQLLPARAEVGLSAAESPRGAPLLRWADTTPVQDVARAVREFIDTYNRTSYELLQEFYGPRDAEAQRAQHAEMRLAATEQRLLEKERQLAEARSMIQKLEGSRALRLARRIGGLRAQVVKRVQRDRGRRQ